MYSAKEKLEIVSGGARRRPPSAAKARAISSVARQDYVVSADSDALISRALLNAANLIKG